MKIRTVGVSIVLLGIVAAVSSVVGDPPAAKQEAVVFRPYPIFAIPEDATPEHEAVATRVTDALERPAPMRMKRNPTCCVWFEITNWRPNPGNEGYVIVNQGGGSTIQASSIEQLNLAVDEFIRQLKDHDGNVLQGLTTNYEIGRIVER